MDAPASRLLTLLSLLQTRRDWSGADLADRLGVSPRTVRRDVERLRDLGYHVRAVKGPDGGYRLDAGAHLPPLLLDDEQAVAVAIGLQLATVAGTGSEDAALRALATLHRLLPPRVRERWQGIAFTAVPAEGAVPAETDRLMRLSRASTDQETVRFEYGMSGSDQTFGAVRRVEPHGVVFADGRWYLVGWDTDRSAWRIFRVDRIALKSHGGGRFTPRPVPGGDVGRFVRSRFRGTDDGAWPCVGSAVVHAPLHDLAPFLGDATAEPAGDRRTVVTAGAWSWDALAASFARFGVALDAPRPAELRGALARVGRRLLAASGDQTEGTKQRHEHGRTADLAEAAR